MEYLPTDILYLLVNHYLEQNVGINLLLTSSTMACMGYEVNKRIGIDLYFKKTDNVRYYYNIEEPIRSICDVVVDGIGVYGAIYYKTIDDILDTITYRCVDRHFINSIQTKFCNDITHIFKYGDILLHRVTCKMVFTVLHAIIHYNKHHTYKDMYTPDLWCIHTPDLCHGLCSEYVYP